MAFSATAGSRQARHFYCDVLGLKLVEDTEFALVFDANGVELQLQKVEQVTSHPWTQLGWAVASIGETVREMTGKGVAMERFSFMEQDDAGIWQSPSGARVAWFKDPDGNVLSLTEHAGVDR